LLKRKFETKLEDFIRRNSLETAVLVARTLRHKTLHQAVFAMTSIREASPNVVGGYGNRTPGVGTRGGIPELVQDGDSGIVIEPGIRGSCRSFLMMKM
jgi:hypothetical protein